MVAERNQLKKIADWFSLEVSIQTANINALVRIFYKMFYLFFDIRKELTLVDEDGFGSIDFVSVGRNGVDDSRRKNTRYHLFIVG
jgi:hypothetical protein